MQYLQPAVYISILILFIFLNLIPYSYVIYLLFSFAFLCMFTILFDNTVYDNIVVGCIVTSFVVNININVKENN
jgi:hypothetical protein